MRPATASRPGYREPGSIHTPLEPTQCGMTDRQEFSEKMTAFVGTHRRIVADFERSLANSRHFIRLADRSSEREPEETVMMLEQIKEIDLLGHLSAQYDEYRNIAGLLPPEDGAPQQDSPLTAEVAELQTQYEALLEEAEGQMEAIDRLLFNLQVQH